MIRDHKWLVGTVIGLVIATLTVWYPLVTARRDECVTLYTADKLPFDQYAACMSSSTALYGAPVLMLLVGGVAVVVWWRRRQFRVFWRHVWPPLALASAVALPVVAALRGSPALLAVMLAILSMCLLYLLSPALVQHRRLLRRVPAKVMARIAARKGQKPWKYDFIEHLYDESTKRCAAGHREGSVIKVVRKARSGSEVRQALFEHPAAIGQSIVEYVIRDIDRRVTDLVLVGSYGILEQFTDEDDILWTCEFPPNSGNKVRFELRANGKMLLQDDKIDFGWTPIEHKDAIEPEGGCVSVQFSTDGMGDPGWNWAGWSEIKLVERL